MAGLSDFLMSLRGQPEPPPDEALDIVQKARRADEYRKQLGSEPGAGVGGLGGFLEKSLPTAFLGLGPPMPSMQTLPMPAQFKPKGDAPSDKSDTDTILKLQRDLRAKGYNIPLDGVMGKETQRAKLDDEQKAQKQQGLDLERMRIEGESKASEAAAATAKAESDRIAATASNRETGDAKLKKAEADMPWYNRFFRDHGQEAGVLAGILGSMATRKMLIGGHKAVQGATTTAANELMAGAPPPGTPVSMGNIGDRAGRVNEFYTKGGASEQPFLNDAAALRGMKSNPDAPQSAALYQPNLTKDILRNAIVPAGGALEYGGAHYVKGQAQEGLDKAIAAYNDNPSDTNLDALQTAKERVAFYGGLERMGQAGITAGVIGGGKTMLSDRTGVRPGTTAADAERAAIDAYLAKAAAPPKGSLPKLSTIIQEPLPVAPPAKAKPVVGGSHPDHTWNEKAGRWQDPNDNNKFLTGPPPTE